MKKTRCLMLTFPALAVLGLAGPAVLDALLQLGMTLTPSQLLTPERTKLFFLLRAADFCVAMFLLALLAVWLFLWIAQDIIGTHTLQRARARILSFVQSR